MNWFAALKAFALVAFLVALAAFMVMLLPTVPTWAGYALAGLLTALAGLALGLLSRAAYRWFDRGA